MTDTNDRAARDIDRFFSDRILPLHAVAHRDRDASIAVAIEPDAASYFVRRRTTQMSRADFESGGLASPDSAAADLQRACARSEAASLATLAAATAALACSLRESQAQSSDVSEFVYAMY